MAKHSRSFVFGIVGLLSTVLMVPRSTAHEATREAAEARRRQVEATAIAQADPAAAQLPPEQTAAVKLRVLDGEGGPPIAALVRITNVDDGLAIRPEGEIHRAENWFSLAGETSLRLPRRKLRIEAIHGLETELAVAEIDLREKSSLTVELSLRRIFDAHKLGLSAGNTHLHLKALGFAEMDRYLRLVPQTDGLDVVFVSHLERKPDDKDYITNVLTSADLARLSVADVQYGNGEEHRHNFGPGDEGYGHVMFLNIRSLIQPVSIGPGIMREGTDGLPLRPGIDEARRQGATVIWCHNRFGLEDIPNWLGDRLHAQNIHDGGQTAHGSYDQTYYRYLNLGMKVPFSTGTDWFVYDFSRVYVPLPQGRDGTIPRGEKVADLKPADWLKQLEAGRTTITNGPLLSFSMGEGTEPGGTILEKRGDTTPEFRVRGGATGRHDFRGIEVVYNGRVVLAAESKPVDGHFEASIDESVTVDRSGWLALRIPDRGQPKNELGEPLFAHTSPIYVEIDGRKPFDSSTADVLMAEMRRALDVIPKRGTFADDAELQRVLKVYREGIATLEKRMAAEAAKPGGSP
jgi:hypothetical protein